MSHFQNWKLKKFRPPLSRSRFFADSGYTKGSNAILANYNKSAEFISCNKTGLSRWTFDLAANSSLWRISLINYRDKDHRVNENDLPFNVGASASIDRSSLSRSASLTEQKKERERDDEQWRTRLETSWIVGGASGFVPDHRQLFDSVRSLQSRFNDRHRSFAFLLRTQRS